MNILKLEEAEKKLGAVQKELEDKKKERDEIQQELEDNKKMLEMKTRERDKIKRDLETKTKEYNRVQAISTEFARKNKRIEKELNDTIIEACFNSIYLQVLSYFVIPLRQIDEYMFEKGKPLSDAEVATVLKTIFGIKKRNDAHWYT